MALHSISLCAGVAGIDLGLRLADPAIRTVCYVEWAKFPAAVIAARIKDGCLDDAPVWDDVGSFDGRPWRGKVDLITAGFPCQPVSLAGKRLGMADERFIWGDIARIIDEVRPGRVFLENVPGIVSADDGRFLDVVLGSLVALGFDCEWDLFSAAETGAPHRRERWFCLGVSNAGRRGMGRIQHVTGTSGGTSDTGTVGESPLANAGDGLVPQPGRGPQGRDGAGPAGPVLGDGAGRQEQRGSVAVRPEQPPAERAVGELADPESEYEQRNRSGQPRNGRGQPANGREPMGNPHDGRQEPADEARAIGTERNTWAVDSGPSGHVYPPARNDYAGWAGIDANAQPAIRRNADGLADGMDPALFAFRPQRLRAVGNGVVALTVALAWLELNDRIGR